MVPIKDREYITSCIIKGIFDKNFFERRKIKKVNFGRDTDILLKEFHLFSGIKLGEGESKNEDIVIYLKNITNRYLWSGAAESFKGKATQYDGLELILSFMKYYKDYNLQPEFDF